MITAYKSTGLFVIMTIVFLLSSCDPLHIIEFVNESDVEVSVYIQVDTSMEFLPLEEMRRGEIISIKVAPNTSEIIDFGMGTWSDYALEEATKIIKRVDIQSSQEIKRYQGQEELMDAFKQHLKGRTIIEFKVE